MRKVKFPNVQKPIARAPGTVQDESMTLTAVAPTVDGVIADSAEQVLFADGAVTDYGMMVYTEGDCWALAYAMSTLMKPAGPRSYRLYTLGETTHWWHVVVRVGHNWYLDATGLSTGEELEQEWVKALVPVEPEDAASWESFKYLLNMDWNYLPEEQEALAVARALLLIHAPHLLK